MRKSILLLALFMFVCIFPSEKYSQEYLNKQAELIVKEANDIYLLERGAWFGTDMLFEKFPKKSENLGGYITYVSGKNTVTSVFYGKGSSPKTIAVFTFNINAKISDAKIDTKERTMTEFENQLRLIRESVYKEMKDSSFYSFYDHTSPNIIPVIKNNEKKAYILTAPKVSNVLIMGNDYQLTFNDDYTLKDIEAFHAGILVQNTDFPQPGKAVSGVHSHVRGKSEFITPTDLCTLLLYSSALNMESYSVISEKYASTWDFKKRILTIQPVEDWKKQYNLK